jgi:hypothetical protein
MAKAGLSVEQHIKLGMALSSAHHLLSNANITVSNYESKNCRAVRKLIRAIDALGSARSELDSDYHCKITDDQFTEHGHVYYK